MKFSDLEHLQNKGYVYLGSNNKGAPIYINGTHLLVCTDLMKETWELYDISNRRKIYNVKDI